MLTCIKFEEHYRLDNLTIELAKAVSYGWTDLSPVEAYEGQCKGIALRSVSGNIDDIGAYSKDAVFRNTALLGELPYTSAILNSWQCEKAQVKFVALYPQSEIKLRKDLNSSYQRGSFKLHIPILTNDQTHFVIANSNYNLNAGSCWYLDLSKSHRIENRGDTVSVYLVIDCIRNEWSDKFFKQQGATKKTKLVMHEVRR